MQRQPEEVADLLQRGLRIGHQLLEADPVLALGGHGAQKLDDVLVADHPDQLGELAAAEGVGVAEEDLVELGLLEGADGGAGVAHQVEIAGRLEVGLGALQGVAAQRIRGGLVDQDPLADPLLEAAVDEAGGEVFGLAALHQQTGLLGAAAVNLHDGADQPFEPEGVAAGKGGVPLGHGAEGEQLQLGRREQARIAGEHDAQQRRARARPGEHEDGGRVLHRRCRHGGERRDDLAQQLDGHRVHPAAGAGLRPGVQPPEAGHGLRVVGHQIPGHPLYGGVIEEGHHVDDLAQGLLQPVDQDGAQDGVAAGLEEGVVDSDLLGGEAEAVGPQLGQMALQAGAGSDEGLRLRRAGLRGGQRLAVHLAVGGQRQGGEQDEGRRDHILGQQPLEEGAQLGDGGLGALFGHHIGDQPQVVCRCRSDGSVGSVRSRQHDRLADSRPREQHRLDLPQLDAEAAHFDLVVDAAEELDLAAGPPAGQIARAVQAPPGQGGERVRDEAVGGQLRPLPIAAAQLHAGHRQLAGHTDRGRLGARTEDVDARVGHRPADRRARRRRRLAQDLMGDVVGALGRAVGVDQGDPRIGREPLPAQLRRQRLAGGDDPAHRRQGGPPVGPHLQQGVEQRGHRLEDGDRPRLDLAQQGQRIAHHLIGYDVDAAADEQGGEELPDGDVEGLDRRLGHAVPAGELEVRDLRPQVVDHAAVLDHHPLGHPGRAGGEEDVGELGGLRRLDLLTGLLPEEPGDPEHPAPGRAEIGGGGEQGIGDQHQVAAALLQRLQQPGRGVVRIQRQAPNAQRLRTPSSLPSIFLLLIMLVIEKERRSSPGEF